MYEIIIIKKNKINKKYKTVDKKEEKKINLVWYAQV